MKNLTDSSLLCKNFSSFCRRALIGIMSFVLVFLFLIAGVEKTRAAVPSDYEEISFGSSDSNYYGSDNTEYWYKTSTTEQGELIFGIKDIDSEADLDIYVYDYQANNLLCSSTNGSGKTDECSVIKETSTEWGFFIKIKTFETGVGGERATLYTRSEELKPDLEIENNIPSPVPYSGGSYTVKIKNTGDGKLTWDSFISQDEDAISSINPSDGIISANSYKDVIVNIASNNESYKKYPIIKFYDSSDMSDYEYLYITQEAKPSPPGKPGILYLDGDDDTGFSNADGITNQTTNLTFSWNAASGLVERYYYEWDNSTPESDYILGNNYSVSEIIVNAPSGDGEHKFYVRAWNSSYGYGDDSSYYKVYIDTKPPDNPSNLHVDEGNPTTDRTPTLDWNDISDAHYYYIEIKKADGSSIYAGEIWNGSNFSVKDSLPIETIYWKVKAIDKAGNESGYSSSSFEVNGVCQNACDPDDYPKCSANGSVLACEQSATGCFEVKETNCENGCSGGMCSGAATLPAETVTVLVHGLHLTGKDVDTNGAYPFGDNFNPIDYWDGKRDDDSDDDRDFIVSILKAFGGGQVFNYDIDTGFFEGTFRPYWEPYYQHEGANHHVLVYDWAESSNDIGGGHAEAAASALFTALVQEKYIDPQNPSNSAKFHFIGHSRGCAVISEVVQRMGVYDIPVHYVTYLDPHDYDEAGVPFDEDFHDPAVQIWDNVKYADNFYQIVIPRCVQQNFIPSGRALVQLVTSIDPTENYQRELTKLPGFSDNQYWCPDLYLWDEYPFCSHSMVIDWYLGTITSNINAQLDTQCSVDISEIKCSDWYSSNPIGFLKWMKKGGFDFENPTKEGIFEPADPVTFENIYPFYDYESHGGEPDEGKNDDNYAPTNFFMGDFNLEDLTEYIGDINVLAGWNYHGGGGKGYVSNSKLILDKEHTSRTHDRFYIPYNATNIEFELGIHKGNGICDYIKQHASQGDNGDKLQIFVNGNLKSERNLYNDYYNCCYGGLCSSTVSIPIDDNDKNQIGTIGFKIDKQFVEVDQSVDSIIYIDNIEINLETTQSPQPDIPPIAKIKLQNTGDIFVGNTVQLSGENSSDPEGKALTFKWSLIQPSGSNASLSSATDSQTSFLPDKAGNYTVILQVSDGTNFDTEQITITAQDATTPSPPQQNILTIAVPNGGEIWRKGTTHNIEWITDMTNPDEETVGIYLYKNGQEIKKIHSQREAHKNYYWWTIPEDLSTISGYTVKIFKNSNTSIFDESDKTFTITDQNIPPVAQSKGIRVFDNQTLQDSIIATDGNDDVLTFSLKTQAQKGTATIINSTLGSFSYTPQAGSIGSDSFVVSVSDGVDSIDAIVSVFITDSNKMPDFKEIKKINAHPSSINIAGVAVSKDKIYSVAEDDSNIKVWNFDGTQEKSITSEEDYILSITVDSNSDKIILGTGITKRGILVYDITSGNLLQRIQSPDVYSVLTQDNKIYASDDDNYIINVWDLSSGSFIKGIPCTQDEKYKHDDSINRIFIKNDLIYSASDDKSIMSWELKDGYYYARYSHEEDVASLFVTEDYVIGGGDHGTIIIRKVSNADRVKRLEDAHNGEITGLWSDGNELISVGEDQKIKIWKNVPNIELRQEIINAHNSPITALAVYEGKIITGSQNGEIKIWERNWNTPPIPAAPNIQTKQNTSATTQVFHNDPDENDTHTYAITTVPQHGTATISNIGLVEYTPETDYYGTDSIEVTVTDNHGNSGKMIISITVLKTTKVCMSNNDCFSNEFCEFESCATLGSGVCKVKPDICLQLLDPVCGCDNNTYPNDCARELAGVSKKHDGECATTTPNISISSDSHDFEKLTVGQTSSPQTLTVTNTGNGSLAINSVSITGEGIDCSGSDCQANPEAFSITNNQCSAKSLASSESCDISVAFNSALPVGKKVANLAIESNDPDTPTLYLGLSGESIQELLPSVEIFSDDFSNGFDRWIKYGSPEPVIHDTAKGKVDVFDNNGDPNYDSGVISKEAVDFPDSLIIESEVYLDFFNLNGCWAEPSIGLTKESNPSTSSTGFSGGRGISMTMNASGDACWGTPSEKRGHSYFWLSIYAEDGASESPDAYSLLADDYINSWHILKIEVTPDSYVKFYIDNNLLWTSTKKLHPDLRQGKHIFLGQRSSGSAGKAYHDWVKVKSDGNTLPTLGIIKPDTTNPVADSSYEITWQDSDPTGNAVISLYYDDNNSGNDGMLINGAQNISASDMANSFIWDTSNIPEGNYYIYAVITDGERTASDYSEGTVTIEHNSSGHTVALISNKSGNYNIWRGTYNGTSITIDSQITHLESPYNVGNFKVDNIHKQIVYSYYQSGKRISNFRVIDFNGNLIRDLTNMPSDGGGSSVFDLSPDCTEMVFSKGMEDQGLDIQEGYIIGLDNQKLRKIIPVNAVRGVNTHKSAYDWVSDDRIIFADTKVWSDYNGQHDIHIYDNGNFSAWGANTSSGDANPLLSPDGKTLAFSYDKTYNLGAGIGLSAWPNGEQQVLVPRPSDNNHMTPRYWVDEEHLIYSSQKDLFAINTNGSGNINLTSTPEYNETAFAILSYGKVAITALLVVDKNSLGSVESEFHKLMEQGGNKVDVIDSMELKADASILNQYSTLACFTYGSETKVQPFDQEVTNIILNWVDNGGVFVTNSQAGSAKILKLGGYMDAYTHSGWYPALKDSTFITGITENEKILKNVIPFIGDPKSQNVSYWDSGDQEALIFRVDNSKSYTDRYCAKGAYDQYIAPTRYLSTGFSTGWEVGNVFDSMPEWRRGKGTIIMVNQLSWTFDQATQSGGYIGIAGRQILKNIAAGLSVTDLIQKTLTINKSGTGSGTITSSPSGINCGEDCSEAYIKGTEITLTATPDENSDFIRWDGGCTGSGDCVVTLNSDTQVTAVFDLKTYTINASSNYGGRVEPSGDVEVTHGETKNFQIIHGEGYHIEDIKVDGSSVGVESSYVFKDIIANHTIEAVFANDPPTVSTIDDQNIDEDTSTDVIHFTIGDTETSAMVLELSAVSSNTALIPESNIILGGSGADRTIQITPAENENGFSDITIKVTDIAGIGSKSTEISFKVNVNPVDDLPIVANPIENVEAHENDPNTIIDLSAVFTDVDNDDTAITKEALSNTNSELVAATINGNDLVLDYQENMSGTAEITIQANSNGKTASAAFTVSVIPSNKHNLSVNKSGTGSGTITSSPLGINCGEDCSEAYIKGTEITLTATPDENSTFSGWSGGSCSGTNDCTITLDSDYTIEASFADTVPPPANAGAALDMDISTRDYDDDISNNDIENTVSASIGDVVTVGVLAQNVSNLDTYQAEISFNPQRLQFMGGAEDNSFNGISNILKKNGGKTIGFNAVFNAEKNDLGTVNIANTLSGTDCAEAPEGSGVIGLLNFKVLDNLPDNNLTLSNVFFIDCNDKQDEIANLMNGSINGVPKWDFNSDGILNYLDLAIFGDHWLCKKGIDTCYCPDESFDCQSPPWDFNRDGIENYLDLAEFGDHWLCKEGEGCYSE